jgi:hypothetical protein
MAGLAAGGIKEIKSCQEIIDEIINYIANYKRILSE